MGQEYTTLHTQFSTKVSETLKDLWQKNQRQLGILCLFFVVSIGCDADLVMFGYNVVMSYVQDTD